MKKRNKKRAIRGGYRKGAGRPKTGRTTATISFSVPITDAKAIKKLVYAKLSDLKNNLHPTTTKETKQIKIPVKLLPATKVSGTDYLTKRRNYKLGLKQ